MGMNLSDIISKIKDAKGLSEEEIKLQISQKRSKLNGLVSEEGAAHILANELGIDLMEAIRKHGVKINRLQPGMRVTITGKVIKCYEVRSFTKGDRSGKVGSFLIGDETGRIRIVLWDLGQISKMESGEIKDGAIIKVENGAVRENNGFKEMHLSGYSALEVNPEGVEDIKVAETSSNLDASSNSEISKLDSVEVGSNASIYGTVVQLFDPRFYDGCSECGKKVTEGNCVNHPEKKPIRIPILNFVIDDGSDNIRCVAFRDDVATLFGVDVAEVENVANDPIKFEEIKTKHLGTQLLLNGKVNSNEMYNRKEFMVRAISSGDEKEILAKLLN